ISVVQLRERGLVPTSHRRDQRGVFGVVAVGNHVLGPYHGHARHGKCRAMLRDAARAAATERTWSQGVALARDGRVAKRSATEFEVRIPGRPTPFEVVIEDDEWQC